MEEHATNVKKTTMEIQELEIVNHVIVTPKDPNRFNVIGKLESATVWMVSIIFTTVIHPIRYVIY